MEQLIAWFDSTRGRRAVAAKMLGVTMGALTQWKRVPVEHVLTLERLTGITRYDLRPDIYGTPRRAAKPKE